MDSSVPKVSAYPTVNGAAAAAGQTPNGWFGQRGDNGNTTVTVYVVCS